MSTTTKSSSSIGIVISVVVVPLLVSMISPNNVIPLWWLQLVTGLMLSRFTTLTKMSQKILRSRQHYQQLDPLCLQKGSQSLVRLTDVIQPPVYKKPLRFNSQKGILPFTVELLPEARKLLDIQSVFAFIALSPGYSLAPMNCSSVPKWVTT